MGKKKKRGGKTTRGVEETKCSIKKKRITTAKELAREPKPDRQKVQRKRKSRPLEGRSERGRGQHKQPERERDDCQLHCQQKKKRVTKTDKLQAAEKKTKREAERVEVESKLR